MNRNNENAANMLKGIVFGIPDYFRGLKKEGPSIVWTRKQIENKSNEFWNSIAKPYELLFQKLLHQNLYF